MERNFRLVGRVPLTPRGMEVIGSPDLDRDTLQMTEVFEVSKHPEAAGLYDVIINRGLVGGRDEGRCHCRGRGQLAGVRLEYTFERSGKRVQRRVAGELFERQKALRDVGEVQELARSEEHTSELQSLM